MVGMRLRSIAVLVLVVALLVGASLASPRWEVEHRVEIAASPAVVWRVLSDLEGYADWNTYSPRVEGTLRVGEIVRVEAHLDDEVRVVDNLVTAVVPQRTLCWQSRNWYRFLAQGTRCRYLEPTGDGRTGFRHHEVMAGPLAWLIERLYRARIEGGLKTADVALKAEAERAAGRL